MNDAQFAFLVFVYRRAFILLREQLEICMEAKDICTVNMILELKSFKDSIGKDSTEKGGGTTTSVVCII